MHSYFLFVLLVILISCGCQTKMQADKDPNPPSTTEKIAVLETPAIKIPAPIIADPEIMPDIIVSPSYPSRLGGSGTPRRKEYVHYVPNSYEFWTNPYFATTHLLEGCTGTNCECSPGEANCKPIPAFANILLEHSNFVACKGGPYAVCYYSGPSDGSTDLSCRLSEDGRFANCKCFAVPWGVYFVDINAILNYDIYQQTVAVCGSDGSGCSSTANTNKAPVCEAINKNQFIPGADLISTFSFDCVPTNGLGQTNCEPSLYAGCMTAPCQFTETPGIVECSCPTFNGPYQVGTTLADPEEECTLGNNLVWSAAFSPSVSTIPPTSPCIPDAPGFNGCPLFDPNTMSAPPGTDCQAICHAYACMNDAGIESAFTCDATLCTGECNERPLLEAACEGLADCPAAGLIEIAKLESAVECSCCASQLCGCVPNTVTNNAIFDLNQRQRDLGVIPQCDLNGTLCGVASTF